MIRDRSNALAELIAAQKRISVGTGDVVGAVVKAREIPMPEELRRFFEQEYHAAQAELEEENKVCSLFGVGTIGAAMRSE